MKRLLVILLFVNSCLFANSNLVEINDIDVRQYGADLIAAKDAAINDAMRIAFSRLFEDDGELAEFRQYQPQFSESHIQDCVFEYTVEHEKMSDSMYMATVSYKFSKEKIFNWLKKFGAVVEQTDDALSSVSVVMRRHDYIDNYQAISQLDHSIDSFSSDRVVCVFNSEEDLLEIDIPYVRLR